MRLSHCKEHMSSQMWSCQNLNSLVLHPKPMPLISLKASPKWNMVVASLAVRFIQAHLTLQQPERRWHDLPLTSEKAVWQKLSYLPKFSSGDTGSDWLALRLRLGLSPPSQGKPQAINFTTVLQRCFHFPSSKVWYLSETSHHNEKQCHTLKSCPLLLN